MSSAISAPYIGINWKSFSKLKGELSNEVNVKEVDKGGEPIKEINEQNEKQQNKEKAEKVDKAEKKERQEKNLCKNCGKDTLFKDLEAVICTSCGIENSMNISKSHEWKSIDKDGGEERSTAPINPLLPKTSMSTMILGGGREFTRKLDKWSDNVYKEKSLMQVFGLINAACKVENIPTCVGSKAQFLYKILSENIIKRGELRSSIIAACLYNACLDYSHRNKQFNKSQIEIARLFKIDKKHMTKGCKCFNEIICNQIEEHEYSFFNKILPKNAKYYVKQYCKKLGIPTDKVLPVCENVRKLGLVNDNVPRSVAVACIYIYIHQGKTKQQLIKIRREISEVCKISEVTILKSYKKLESWKRFIICTSITNGSNSLKILHTI